MGTSSLRDVFSCRRESICCRSRLCVEAQRLSFPLSSSCRALSCCLKAWRGEDEDKGGQTLLLVHRVLSFRSVGWSVSPHCHLDLLPLLLVGDGSGGRQVLLKHLALLLQLAALLPLVLLKLGQLFGLRLLELQTLFPKGQKIKTAGGKKS